MEKVNELAEKWKTKLIIPLQEYFLYRIIAGKPRYGREIIQLSQKYLSLDVKVPTIYGLLKKGEEDGFLKILTITEEEGITRGNPRKYYILTNEGIEYFQTIQKEIEILRHIPFGDKSKESKI